MHEHYENCPWREQALYNMDSRNAMLFTYIAFNDYKFARSNLTLMANGLLDDGLLNICFPSGIDEKFGKMLDAGSTTFWETELGYKDFNMRGSLCHAWSALPIYFYTLLNGKNYFNGSL